MREPIHRPQVGNDMSPELREIIAAKRTESGLGDACEADLHDRCVAPWCECPEREHPQQGHGAWVTE